MDESISSIKELVLEVLCRTSAAILMIGTEDPDNERLHSKDGLTKERKICF